MSIDPKFEELSRKFNNITKDDAYIICSYSMEADEREYSPYKILNMNLVQNEIEDRLKNISKYLYLFLKSLRKLPRYYPSNNSKYLYRTLSVQVSISKENSNGESSSFCIGSKKTFLGFMSTCIDPSTAYSFLRRDSDIKKGTIFILGGDVWGYDIALFNYFNEKEILLEPGTNYIVENALPPLNGVIYISCNVIDSDGKKLNEKKSSLQNQGKLTLDEEINNLKENFDKNVKNFSD